MAYGSNSLSVTGNTIVNDMGRGTALWNAGGAPATFANNSVYGFGSTALVSGPADQSGTNVLSTRPTLDTSAVSLTTPTPVPTVSSVTAPTGDDGPGTVIPLVVNFSKTVTVAGGTPTLKLSNGATATYVSGSGTGALTFNYTVGATGSSQDAADLGTAATSALVLNGATIKDTTGNPAVLTGADNVNPAGTLQIDTTAPNAPAITSTGGTTNSATQTIAGTAEKGSAVQLYDNGTAVGTAVAANATSGAWSVSVSLAAGSNGMTAKATDVAGNSSPASTAVVYTLDTTV